MPASMLDKPARTKPRVGISDCLLGRQVRYDGGHKWSAICAETIAPFVELSGLCPETAIGMPTPRPPMDLFITPAGIEAQGKEDATLNPTQALRQYAEKVAATEALDGYIFMQRSPSCGLRSSRVYQAGDLIHAQGQGVYAERLQTANPHLLMVEEQELQDPTRRLAFLCGVHLSQALRESETVDSQDLEGFHRRYRYLYSALDAEFPGADSLFTESDPAFSAGFRDRLYRLLQKRILEPLSETALLDRLKLALLELHGIRVQAGTLAKLAEEIDQHPETGLATFGFFQTGFPS